MVSQFRYALSLEGHGDWVRCLAFTPYPSASGSSNDDLLLATGSQDNLIRLWRVSDIPAQGVRPGTHGFADDADDTLDMLDEFERKLGGEASGSVQLSTRAHILVVGDGKG